MNLTNHLDKNNLHHAYLIEGDKEIILPDILAFIENLGINILSNPDFSHLSFDTFKIEDARNLKEFGYEKSFSIDKTNNKRIFIISANNFLLEAQNTLLKIFEEPIENTHFFVIVPNKNILLKTLFSRFYFISVKKNLLDKNTKEDIELKEIEKFIKISLRDRLDFIKKLLTESEESPEESSRLRALKFLNALEIVTSRSNLDTKINFFEHLFKVREFLNQPGSSVKSLMESVALIIPNN